MVAQPRYRERANQAPTSLTYEAHQYGPPPVYFAPISGVELTGSYLGSFKAISDMTNTGFVKTRDPSRWVQNPCTISNLTIKHCTGSSTTSNNPDSHGRGITRTWQGDGISYIFGPLVSAQKSVNFGSYPDLFDTSRVSDRAAIKCWAEVNAIKAQMWTTIAEGNKSINMVFDRARKLAATYVACRRGDLAALKILYPSLRKAKPPKRVILWDDNGQPIIRKNGKTVNRYSHKTLTRRQLGFLSEPDKLWLEYRYGWSPLVLDIQSQMKAVYAQDLRDELTKQDYRRAIAGDTREATSSIQLNRPHFGGGSWTGLQTLTHKVSAVAYVKYQVIDESGFMNRAHEFGIFDIPLATWELVPFSFVVDWFVPIGTWLQAVQPKFGVKVLDSGITVKHSKDVTRTLSGYAPSGSGVGQWSTAPFPLGSSDGFEAQIYSRSIGLPVPFLPVPDVKLNIQRLADAATLLKGVRQSNLRI